MKNKHVKTVLNWVVLSILFIGMVGYEWLPTDYRGSWLFILLLTISGAYVRFKQAIFIGLCAFFLVGLYFLFDLATQNTVDRQILLLFTVTFSPLFLSAVRYNLLSDQFSKNTIHRIHNDSSSHILPIETWPQVSAQLMKMLPFFRYPNYEIIDIKIKNSQLISTMLGEDAWNQIQNQILNLLLRHSDDATYLFADKNFTEIKYVLFRENPSQDNLPPFIQEILTISGLDSELSYTVRDVQASIKEGQYVSIH